MEPEILPKVNKTTGLELLATIVAKIVNRPVMVYQDEKLVVGVEPNVIVDKQKKEIIK